MITKIFGYLILLWGVIFFFFPQYFRKMIGKKTTKKIKRYIFSFAIILGILFLSIAFTHKGVVAKLIGILGIIAVVKAFFFLKRRLAERIIKWVLSQPLSFFRMGAVIYIVIGLAIIYLK